MQKKDFNINIPFDAKRMLSLLNESGFQGYVVGGCVRDAMAGKVPHDYDICTSATPEQMKQVFSKAGYNTYDTGLQHGTISVLGPTDHDVYEITTYRLDGEYTDGRHPDEVKFVTDIKQDLSRRDFTINAMCYNDINGLVDPFNGAEDLKNKIIRCVGEPNKRFQEDGLRIMRAIRFAATYGFEIEENTKTAIHANKHLLKNVSAERKTVEFVRMITHADAKLLLEYGDVFAEFIPEIIPMFGLDQKTPWHKFDVWKHTAKAVELTPTDPTLRVAVFFHDIGKPSAFQIDPTGRGHFKSHPEIGANLSESIMKRMRFDTQSIKNVYTLVKHHDDPIAHNMDPTNIKMLLNSIGEKQLRQLVPIQKADKQAQRFNREELEKMDRATMTYEEAVTLGQLRALDKFDDEITNVINSGEPYLLKDLKVNGNDMMTLGITGKDIGDTLNHLLLQVIQNPELNTRDRLCHMAKQHLEYVNAEREEIEYLDRR